MNELLELLHTTFNNYKNTFLLIDNATTCDMIYSTAFMKSVTLYTNIYIYNHFTYKGLLPIHSIKHHYNKITCNLFGIAVTLFNVLPVETSVLNIKYLHYDLVTDTFINSLNKQPLPFNDVLRFQVNFINPDNVKAHAVFELYELAKLYEIELPKIRIVSTDGIDKAVIKKSFKNMELHGKLDDEVVNHINENVLFKRILGITLFVKIENKYKLTINTIESLILIIWLSMENSLKIVLPVYEIELYDEDVMDFSDKIRISMNKVAKLKTINDVANELIKNINCMKLEPTEIETIKQKFTIIKILNIGLEGGKTADLPIRYAYIIFKYGAIIDDDVFRELVSFFADIEFFLSVKNNEVLKQFNREIIELIPLFANVNSPATRDSSPISAINIYDLQNSMIYIYENFFSNRKDEITIDRCRELFHSIFSGMRVNMFMQTTFNANYLLEKFGTEKIIDSEPEVKTKKKQDKEKYEYYKNRYTELKKYLEDTKNSTSATGIADDGDETI